MEKQDFERYGINRKIMMNRKGNTRWVSYFLTSSVEDFLNNPADVLLRLQEREWKIFGHRAKRTQSDAWQKQIHAIERLLQNANISPHTHLFFEVGFESDEADDWKKDPREKRIDLLLLGETAERESSLFACECKSWDTPAWRVLPIKYSKRLLIHIHEERGNYLQLNPRRYVAECVNWLQQLARAHGMPAQVQGAVYLHEVPDGSLPGLFDIWHDQRYLIQNRDSHNPTQVYDIPVYTNGMIDDFVSHLRKCLVHPPSSKNVDQLCQILNHPPAFES